MRTENVYTFGDSDRAAERLYWLSQTFDPTSLQFVRAAVEPGQKCCVDLGAGPGFFTRALHEQLRPARSVGLESSARFVEFGRKALPPTVELIEHDVLEPLPMSAPLLVSRFLLTHLREPERALGNWLAAAEPGGLLLLEELSGMTADLPELQMYYGLVARVQQAAGQDMHVGSRIGSLAQRAGWSLHSQRVERLLFPVPVMARLHALNLPTLRQQAVVREHYEERELDTLQTVLADLAASQTSDFVRVDMARCEARRAYAPST